ncbi:MAG: hypothetical protein H5U08_00275 [Thermogutta sp.]|uniref:hypothetical protein n=1 Tax=Thermogutta sp. TaxID=1962930 RepID=UPI0019BC0D37|nr:hypothetical protein [Thermogutta sp.]MBC7350770.1 hypothetical protein [Thermogutta sp.]
MIDRRSVARSVLYLGEPVAVVPGVLGDVRVARVELAVLIGVDEAIRAVAFGIVEIAVGPVGQKPVVGAGGVGTAVGGNAVAVGVVLVTFIALIVVVGGGELPGGVAGEGGRGTIGVGLAGKAGRLGNYGAAK